MHLELEELFLSIGVAPEVTKDTDGFGIHLIIILRKVGSIESTLVCHLIVARNMILVLIALNNMLSGTMHKILMIF